MHGVRQDLHDHALTDQGKEQNQTSVAHLANRAIAAAHHRCLEEATQPDRPGLSHQSDPNEQRVADRSLRATVNQRHNRTHERRTRNVRVGLSITKRKVTTGGAVS
jgi:hypothetical protein